MNAATHRERYRRESQAAILAEARKIFVREGYESFSMRKLAQAAGCSAGNLYLHFRSRRELFEALVEESFAKLHRALQKLEERAKRTGHAGSAEMLRQGLRLYVEFGLRNPNDYRFAFLLARPPERRAYRVHAAFDVLRRMVKACVEKGEFRGVDVEATSQTLWAAAHGITSLLIQRPAFPWVSRKLLIERVIDGALDGLIVPPARRRRRGGRHGGSRSGRKR